MNQIELFHKNLTVLGNKTLQSQVCGEKLVISAKGKNDDKTNWLIIKYIEEHKDYLRKSDVKSLKSIQKKICNPVFTEELSHYIRLAEANTPKTNSIVTVEGVALLLQVAPPPVTPEDLLANLALLRQYFPKYQFGNDLSVYDATYGNLPAETHNRIIREELDKVLASCDSSKMPEALYTSLCSEVQWMKTALRPMIPVQMAIIIEQDFQENGAMLVSVEAAVKAEIPFVMTKHLLHCHLGQFEILLKPCDVYSSKAGELVLVLPQGKAPRDYGFNDQELRQLAENEKDDLKQIKPQQLSLGKELDSLLLSDESDLGFYRVIHLAGHGSSKLDPLHGGGLIANLRKKDFQETFAVLQKKNVVFLGITSCHIGGANREDLHLEDHSIPCLMYVRGVFDYPSTTSGRDEMLVLKRASECLFKQDFGVRGPSIPRSLTQKDMEGIVGSKKSNPNCNCATYHFPKSASAPQAFYVEQEEGQILSMDQLRKAEFLKAMCKGKLESPCVVAPSVKATGYLFSEPAFAATLQIPHQVRPPSLISAGGNAHHAIKEIDAKNFELEALLGASWNAAHQQIESKDFSRGPAHKVFAVAKLTCKMAGQLVILRDVVISQSSEVCHCLFRKEGETGFYEIVFDFNQTFDEAALKRGSTHYIWVQWKKASEKTLSEEEFLMSAYELFFASRPTQLAHQESDQAFYDAVNVYFWEGNPPAVAQLFHSLIHDVPTLSEREGQLVRSTAFNDHLHQWAKGADAGRKRLVLKKALEFSAQFLGFSQEHKDLIERASRSPLLEIVQSRNLTASDLELYKQHLNDQDVHGYAPLHIAAMRKDIQAIGLLLEAGASLKTKTDRRGYTVVDFLFEDQHLIRELIAASASCRQDFLFCAAQSQNKAIVTLLLRDFQMDLRCQNGAGETVLSRTIDALDKDCDESFIPFLLRNGALADQAIGENQLNALQYVISRMSSNTQVFDVLLNATQDLNYQDKQGNTALHLALQTNQLSIVEKLIQKGVRLELPNQAGETAAQLLGSLLLNIFKQQKISNLCFAEFVLSHSIEFNQSTYIDLLNTISIKKEGSIVDLCDVLLNKIEDVNRFDGEGLSPLHYAAANGNTHLVQLLIAKGARNESSKEETPETPLEMLVNLAAARSRRQKCLDMLQVFLSSGISLQEGVCIQAIREAMKFSGVEFVRLLASRVDSQRFSEPALTDIQQFLKKHQIFIQ